MSTSRGAAESEGVDDAVISQLKGWQKEWPMAMSVPLARADISTVPLDDNVAIYDEVGRVLVLLNASAFAVLECCDGTVPFKNIVATLAERYTIDLEIVTEDVWRTVRKLASMGLVADAS